MSLSGPPLARFVRPFAIAAGIAVGACHDDARSQGAGAAASATPVASNASAAPAPLASNAPRASASGRPPSGPPLCKAISVGGAPKLSFLTPTPAAEGADGSAPTTLVESADIPADAWITLDAAGKLTAKHPRSTRETTFLGPALVRPCVGFVEEAWVERGKVESEPAAGSRPGAEEWVMTPVGVVRFGAGRVELNVLPATATAGEAVEVKVSSGTAYAWTGDTVGPVKPPVAPAPAPSAGGSAGMNDGWLRLEGPRTVTLSIPRPAKAEDVASAGLERCRAAAKAAKDFAAQIAAPDASLAELAPRHVISRQVARAACGVAAVRAGALAPSPKRDSLLAALKEAEADWKSFRPRGLRGRPH